METMRKIKILSEGELPLRLQLALKFDKDFQKLAEGFGMDFQQGTPNYSSYIKNSISEEGLYQAGKSYLEAIGPQMKEDIVAAIKEMFPYYHDYYAKECATFWQDRADEVLPHMMDYFGTVLFVELREQRLDHKAALNRMSTLSNTMFKLVQMAVNIMVYEQFWELFESDVL